MKEELEKDIKQFQGAMEDFYNLTSDDIETAYSLAIVFMQLANRWTEVPRTAFRDYAYEHYRQCSKAHEFCRVVWRQGKEEYKNSFINE